MYCARLSKMDMTWVLVSSIPNIVPAMIWILSRITSA